MLKNLGCLGVRLNIITDTRACQLHCERMVLIGCHFSSTQRVCCKKRQTKPQLLTVFQMI